MPKKYWNDLKVAEQLNSQGDAMHEKMSEIYLNEYTDISCAEDEKDRYIPDMVSDEREQYKPALTADSLFPHST